MPASNLIYGLHTLEDRVADTLLSVGEVVISDALQTWNAAYNTMTNSFLSSVVQQNPLWNESPITRFELPVPLSFQFLDEQGLADPVKIGQSYQIGLPLSRAGASFGDLWERRQILTVRDLSNRLTAVQAGDRQFLMRQAIRALFNNSGWTSNSAAWDTESPPSVPILPLANGDAFAYALKNGGTTTANHYTAQAAQVGVGTDPFPTLHDTLTRYAASGDSPRLVAFVNGTSLINGILTLPDFQPASHSRYIEEGPSVRTLNPAITSELFFGDRVLGEHASGIVINVWSQLPDNYIVIMDMNQKPLGMRESRYAELRGLLTFTASEVRGMEIHDQYRRIAGIGVVNRIAGAVHQVASGGVVYGVPTGWSAII